MMPMKCEADNLKYFTFVSHILFLHMYDPFSIPVWQSDMVFAYGCEVFIAVHKHFTFGSHIFI